MSDPTTLLTSDDGRYFLVRAGQVLGTGNLRLVSSAGEERLADPAAAMAYEVTESQAEAHLRGEARRVALDVTGRLARALDAPGKEPPDLDQLAERLGLARGGEEAEAALRGLMGDIEAILGALASEQPADLDMALERLEAHGLGLGGLLGHLRQELGEIRQFDQLNQQAVPNAAVNRLRAVAKSVGSDSGQPPGRRADELITRLEREVGPCTGQDPEEDRKRRQEEYRRQARSAIAESLREAGIKPLNDPNEEAR